jgi:hypothetical protein
MQLCIREIDPNVTRAQIAAIFLWFGEIQSVEIEHNVACISYATMYNNHRNDSIQRELTENNKAHVYYNDTQYWSVYLQGS